MDGKLWSCPSAAAPGFWVRVRVRQHVPPCYGPPAAAPCSMCPLQAGVPQAHHHHGMLVQQLVCVAARVGAAEPDCAVCASGTARSVQCCLVIAEHEFISATSSSN